MDVAKKEDVLLLIDEKFDFDLSLSSSSANEDDEVFFGPVGHKERCIAASLELNDRIPQPPLLPASDSPCTLSPLTGEKFVEVYKEAHLLALQIERHSRKEVAQAAEPENPGSQGVERFIQESKLKMKLFEKGQEIEKSPKSLKRETYYLSDSPFDGPPLLGTQPPSGEPLPPASSPALPRAPTPAGPALAQGLPHSSHPLPGEPSTAHPPNQAVPQKRLTSKLQPPRSGSGRGKHLPSAMEKPKKEAPASPSRAKLLTEKEPLGHVLPDKPSMAVDAASLPASRSHRGQGKPSLPVPIKLGLKKTLLKPPRCTGSLTRKSSSGSVSSGTSNVCPSPAAGTAKSSELASVPASSSRPLSSSCKVGRTGPALLCQSLPAAPAEVSCRQARRAEQPKAPATAPLTQPQTPESRGPRLDPHSVLPTSSQLNKIGSIRRRDSYLNSKTKVLPTPTNSSKFPKFSVGESPDSVTPRFSRVQRLQSCASAGRVAVHSTPARHSSGSALQSPLSSRGAPRSVRRMSLLPTPGRPLVTPKTLPRALASPLCVPARALSSEPRKRSAVRAEPTTESSSGAGCGQPGLSPGQSFSPPSSVPQVLRFSPEKSDFPFSQDFTTGAIQADPKPREEPCPREALLIDIGLDELTIAPEVDSRAPVDLPLIDFGSSPEADMALGSASRPLIDLMINTPDGNRNDVAKLSQAEGQLIDLGSPLLQLSSEADKENVDSPLLKF